MTPPVTSIVFNDGVSATLTNGKPYPANRFDNWTPATAPYGSLVHRQSDQTPTMLKLGTVFGASFQLSKIPDRTTSALRLTDIANRLVAHLENAGSVTINTGDVNTAIYTGCYLLQGFTPTLVLSDPNQLEYTLSLALHQPGGSHLVCHYDI